MSTVKVTVLNSFRYPVDEIRERCDLVDVISAYVALRKRGKALVGLCPFHNEKTPSFQVNPERGIWKCFGCGEGGDVFSFVRKIENVSFAEAAELLARKAGVHIDRSERAVRETSEKERLLHAMSVACGFYRKALTTSRQAQDFCAKRGLNEQIIEKYRIGYAPAEWGELYDHLMQMRINEADAIKAGLVISRENSRGCYDRFRDRLIVPIFDNSDRVIAFGGRALDNSEPKYLNSPESPVFIKNKTLYGLSYARKAISKLDQAIVVEGYMDVISTQAAGFENTVATMGTALTEEHVNVLSRFTHNVVISFDADSAGMSAALRSWPIFERAGFNIRILSMPRGEDPDSILRSGDASKFAALIESSLPVPDYRVDIVLGKHDLSTDEGRSAALTGAAAVLADVQSAVERERLIRRLAKYHPNFSTGTILAEDHLRQEVNRYRARLRKTSENAPGNSVIADQNTNAVPKLSLVEKSQKLLLGIIILRAADISKVFEALPAKNFIDDDARLLAEAVSSVHSELGKIDNGRLREMVADTPAENLLLDILVGLDESELNHPIDDLILVIKNHKKNERLRRMRALAQKIQEGTIGRGDEEYEEYFRLLKETASPFKR